MPTVSTWGVVKDFMATNEVDWPLALSEELFEGLSSSERGNRDALSKAIPSATASSSYLTFPNPK
jgi:hypothetical protein